MKQKKIASYLKNNKKKYDNYRGWNIYYEFYLNDNIQIVANHKHIKVIRDGEDRELTISGKIKNIFDLDDMFNSMKDYIDTYMPKTAIKTLDKTQTN